MNASKCLCFSRSRNLELDDLSLNPKQKKNEKAGAFICCWEVQFHLTHAAGPMFPHPYIHRYTQPYL